MFSNNTTGYLGPSPLPVDVIVFLDIGLYVIMFVVAAIGNVTMFLVLLRNLRKTKQNRVYTLLLHLNMADLLVTFVAMPNKIISAAVWHRFLLWGWVCPALKFLDIFGLYASSNILICMSIDRLCAITRPLYSLKARTTIKFLLFTAWFAAALLSLPQLSIFEKLHFPHAPYQHISMCVTPGKAMEFALTTSILNAITCYFLPAITIAVSYGIILSKVSRNQSRTNEVEDSETAPAPAANHEFMSMKKRKSTLTSNKDAPMLRRSENMQIKMARARHRTLRVTALIVSLFLICWTPYYFILSIDLYDTFTAKRKGLPSNIPTWLSSATLQGNIVQTFLFAFAMMNTCANPFVYGHCSFNMCRELHLLQKTMCCDACSKCGPCQREAREQFHSRSNITGVQRLSLDATQTHHAFDVSSLSIDTGAHMRLAS